MGLLTSIKSFASNAVSLVKAVINKQVSDLKAIDTKLGGGGSSKLSTQLIGGAKLAAVAIPTTKAAELPGAAAKAITAAKGIGSAVFTSAKSYAKANPLKTSVVGAVGAGYIIQNPTQAYRDISSTINNAPQDLVNFGGNLSKIRSDPSLQNIATTFKENPVISSGVIAGAGLLIGRGVGIVTDVINTKDNKPNVIENVLPSSEYIKETAVNTNTQPPITPETQVMGKPATSNTKQLRKYSSKSRRVSPQSNTLRVQIFNQSKIQSVKYLNARRY